MADHKAEKKYEYTQTCSRCDGSGVDPDMPDCSCDCCEDGVEHLFLTQEEAKQFPDARRKGDKT